MTGDVRVIFDELMEWRIGYLLIKEVGNLVRGTDDTAIGGGVNDKTPSDQAADVFANAYALKWEVHQRCN